MPNLSSQQRAWRARAILATMLVALLASCTWGIRWLTAPPANRDAAEAHLERDLLAYERWDNTSVVVFTLDGTGLVYLDYLWLDPVPMGWPPKPRWQWSGEWAYIEASSEPASAGYGLGTWGAALFGQIHDPAIVRISCQLDATTVTAPVATPGYAVELPDGTKRPESCDFLDASGTRVWTAPVIASEV